MKFKGFFNNKSKGKNFFEMSSEEKKRIIKNAVRGSNELQLQLVKEYTQKYSV